MENLGPKPITNIILDCETWRLKAALPASPPAFAAFSQVLRQRASVWIQVDALKPTALPIKCSMEKSQSLPQHKKPRRDAVSISL